MPKAIKGNASRKSREPGACPSDLDDWFLAARHVTTGAAR